MTYTEVSYRNNKIELISRHKTISMIVKIGQHSTVCYLKDKNNGSSRNVFDFAFGLSRGYKPVLESMVEYAKQEYSRKYSFPISIFVDENKIKIEYDDGVVRNEEYDFPLVVGYYLVKHIGNIPVVIDISRYGLLYVYNEQTQNHIVRSALREFNLLGFEDIVKINVDSNNISFRLFEEK